MCIVGCEQQYKEHCLTRCHFVVDLASLMLRIHAGELAESRDMNESFTEYNDELLAENNSLTAERKELLRVRDELGDKNQELLERCARLQVTSAAAERRANAASNMLTCQVQLPPLPLFALST